VVLAHAEGFRVTRHADGLLVGLPSRIAVTPRVPHCPPPPYPRACRHSASTRKTLVVSLRCTFINDCRSTMTRRRACWSWCLRRRTTGSAARTTTSSALPCWCAHAHGSKPGSPSQADSSIVVSEAEGTGAACSTRLSRLARQRRRSKPSAALGAAGTPYSKVP